MCVVRKDTDGHNCVRELSTISTHETTITRDSLH